MTAREGVRTWVFSVRARSDAVVASSQARRLAREWGLGAKRSMELAIVVSELATNIVKHGIQGELSLSLHPAASPRPEITVVAHDAGPPIRDLELAMTDGYDDQGPIDPSLLLRRGGLGTGLGAIARLADRVEYRQEADGKAITARFFL
ncbi:MAG TPA: ATP-binding protein [Thermoanaerobaculia bacterium]|nr:ATP-binding protein [Thermoanaerobaculia bacterium]